MNTGKPNWELQVKFLTGETDSTEKTKLENWLNESANNRRELEKNRALLKKVDDFYKIKNFDSGEALKNVQSKINQKHKSIAEHKNVRKEALIQFYKMAAIIIIALLLGSVGYYIGFRNQKPAVFQEIISAKNQVLNEYVLPDGTVVALNSNSQLLFPKKFTNNKREVFLVGEAFFNVIPNPEKPFEIHAGEALVKVLGTSFTVRAYPENETVDVVVETGKVEVLNSTAGPQSEPVGIFLEPGERGTLYLANKKFEKRVNFDPNYLAWKTHDLIFNEVPLKDVVQCLENVYHVQIDLTDTNLNNLLYTSHFNKKQIGFILEVISSTFNLELSVDENEEYALYTLNTTQ